jgi:hypothetical protein
MLPTLQYLPPFDTGAAISRAAVKATPAVDDENSFRLAPLP